MSQLLFKYHARWIFQFHFVLLPASVSRVDLGVTVHVRRQGEKLECQHWNLSFRNSDCKGGLCLSAWGRAGVTCWGWVWAQRGRWKGWLPRYSLVESWGSLIAIACSLHIENSGFLFQLRLTVRPTCKNSLFPVCYLSHLPAVEWWISHLKWLVLWSYNLFM